MNSTHKVEPYGVREEGWLVPNDWRVTVRERCALRTVATALRPTDIVPYRAIRHKKGMMLTVTAHHRWATVWVPTGWVHCPPAGWVEILVDDMRVAVEVADDEYA